MAVGTGLNGRERKDPSHTRKNYLQRCCAPSDTLSRITPHFRRIGLTRIADVTGLDCIGIPVVMAVRPNSRSLSVSQGKGIDLVGAKVAGAMEAIEAYHAERIASPVVLARFNELSGSSKMVDPRRLPAREGSDFHLELQIPWIEGFDVRTRSPIFVPFEVVQLDFSPTPFRNRCFPVNSNGLASGNTYIEAVNHSVCELIERDAVALWRASGEASGQRIDLATVTDDRLGTLVEKIAAAGCRLVVEEITSDVGVPVFLATLAGTDSENEVTPRPAGGAGCHPNRAIACIRAISEAAQSRLTRIAGSRDDLTFRWFAPMDRGTATRDPESVADSKPFGDGSNFLSDNLDDDFGWLLTQLASAGLEQIAVVDLTKPEFGIPVVRAIVPGLEGLSRQSGYVQGERAKRVHAAQ